MSDSTSNGFFISTLEKGLVFTDMSLDKNELDYSLAESISFCCSDESLTGGWIICSISATKFWRGCYSTCPEAKDCAFLNFLGSVFF